MTSISDVIEQKYSNGQYRYDRPETVADAASLPPKWQLVWKLEEILGLETSAWGKRKPEFKKSDLQEMLDCIQSEFQVEPVVICRDGGEKEK